MAANVVTLKASVPTSWTTAIHQSMRRGAQATSRRKPRGTGASASSPKGAVIDSRSWPYAAEVKKIDPTKKVQPTVATETRSPYRGNAPSAKHSDPTMKSPPSTTLDIRARRHARRPLDPSVRNPRRLR